MKFCPKCGRKGIDGVLCRDCSSEQSSIKFREIRIKFCIDCKSYLFKNKWVKADSIEEVIKRIAKKSLKSRIAGEIIPLLPEIEFKPGINYDFEVKIKVSPKEKYFIPARIEMTTCPKCSKKGTKYFEGVLQLRNPNEEVIGFIRNDIRGQAGKGVYITKEERVEYGKGVDFYITSQKYLQTLGFKLQKKFGGIMKVNSRLFSRNKQTSKDIFRVNVLFEMLDFKVGDVVLVGNKPIKVTDISKIATGYDLAMEKKTNFEYKKKDYRVLERKKTSVVKIYPSVEVMDPETYQNLKTGNRKNVSMGDEVEVVIVEGIAYMV
ncbi:hypothetical protein COV19_02560 [Candidatus Woesearchaeota archaeon CG10_big_fil_rev_8_21_14_0_10_44_13]|nr:MAG: hypothetical protein COV19_02560 [Candidatus Woesearchaeota archaeon CG10_big_fil_rev_8_21_14_0_10_44_13]